MKRLRTLFSSLLVASLLFVSAPKVDASYTVNLAGRPIMGSAYTWCQGVAYGRVDGALVLFTANHCADGRGQGDIVLDPNGSMLGSWHYTGHSEEHDLAWIELIAGAHPSNLNQVYRGGFAPTDYATITQPYPSSSLSCASIDSRFGVATSQYFQNTTQSIANPRTGHITGYTWYTPSTNQCLVQTDIPAQCCGIKDSGSPFGLYGFSYTMFALATGGANGGGLQVTPLYEGIHAIDDFYYARGNHLGAFMCYTASCPSEDMGD
jgi:hypothetical protein